MDFEERRAIVDAEHVGDLLARVTMLGPDYLKNLRRLILEMKKNRRENLDATEIAILSAIINAIDEEGKQL